MRTLAVTLAIVLLGLSSTASAHFVLISPPPSNPVDNLKNADGTYKNAQDQAAGKGSPPCGPDTVMAATPTPAQGGHAIMLNLIETTPHTGFYRVALALTTRSDLPVDNVVHDSKGMVLPPNDNPDGVSGEADYETVPVFPVLGDHLFQHNGTGVMTFQQMIMLPNVNCDRCIMQVIEYMNGHGFNHSVPGPGGGYFYHHCAELKITADPSIPLFVPGTDGGAPDAAPHDASAEDASNPDASTMGAGGVGEAGASGSGFGGASGAAGASSAGSAGTSGSIGAAGAQGGAGAGTSTGTAGSSVGNERTSSGGCSVGEAGPVGLRSVVGFALLALVLLRRSRAHRTRV